MDSTGDSECDILDSADYLFKNTKYHDRQITVGVPSLDNVEEIGVVTVHLVSQSTVFRAMFENSMLADQTGQSTHITDVSPEIFKLMLRFMYGGKMPQLSRNTLADLLICADKYNIQSLLKWSSVRLVPSSLEDFYPAVMCVAYVKLPDLQLLVTKILEEQTVEVLNSKQFFELDDRCLEFIAMQKKLAVSELQLWKSLVGWAKAKAGDPLEQRRLLSKPLKYVRFHRFTQEQIVKEVLNTNMLSPAEFVHILSAVTNNQPITMPGLCSIKEERGFSGASCILVKKPVKLPCTVSCHFHSSIHVSEEVPEYQKVSEFTITCLGKQINLQSFTIKPRSRTAQGYVTYNLQCSINIFIHDQRRSVKESLNTYCIYYLVSGMEDFELDLKLKNGQPLVLNPYTCYTFMITFDEPHPVYCTYHKVYNSPRKDVTTSAEIRNDVILLKYATPYHLKEIKYMSN